MATPTPITSFATGTPADADYMIGVDSSDTTQSPQGTTKKFLFSAFKNYVGHADESEHQSCRVATTTALNVVYDNGTAGVGATLTNNGALAAIAIDGVTLALNDRVLVKDQASASQNGIYTVTTLGSGIAAWIMTRATDFNGSAATDIAQGDFTFVSLGMTNAASAWVMNSEGPFVVGTTDIVWVGLNVAVGSGILPMLSGGTGKALTASNGAIVYSDSNSFELLSPSIVAGRILQSGAASAPTWSTPTYPSAAGSAGQLIRSNGSNNLYTTATFADTYAVSTILYASSANAVSGLATANNGVLVTNLTGVPSISATLPTPVQDNITRLGTIVAGTWAGTVIGPTVGGTGLTSYAQGDLLYGSATNTLAKLAKDTNATRYLSNTGSSNNPAWAQINLANGVTGNLAVANLNSGTNATAISYWNGAGAWTSVPESVVTVPVSGTTQAAAVNNRYLCDNVGLTTVTLPASFAVGDVIIVDATGAGGFIIAYGTGQAIRYGATLTTTTTGTLASSARGDCVRLVGVTANTLMLVESAFGTLIPV